FKSSRKRGEAERRQAHHLGRASGRDRASSGTRSPLGAPPRHSPRLLPLGSAPGPRFLKLPGANGRTLPGVSAAISSRTGHSAGRSVPEAARERGMSFRARAPLSLHFRKHPRERSLDEQDLPRITEIGTDVKSCHCGGDKNFCSSL